MDLPATGGGLAGRNQRARDWPNARSPARGGQVAALPQVVCPQRGPVADQPQVAERVDEAALPVNSPRCFVITDLVDAAVGSSRHGAFDEAIRVNYEHLDPDRSRAKDSRGVPTVLSRARRERTDHQQRSAPPRRQGSTVQWRRVPVRTTARRPRHRARRALPRSPEDELRPSPAISLGKPCRGVTTCHAKKPARCGSQLPPASPAISCRLPGARPAPWRPRSAHAPRCCRTRRRLRGRVTGLTADHQPTTPDLPNNSLTMIK